MIDDQLICGVCRGEKVIRKHVANLVKVDICPKCNGTGSLMSENDWRKKNGKKFVNCKRVVRDLVKVASGIGRPSGKKCTV